MLISTFLLPIGWGFRNRGYVSPNIILTTMTVIIYAFVVLQAWYTLRPNTVCNRTFT